MSRERRFEESESLRAGLLAGGWYHSFELPDGTRIEGAIPLERLRRRAAELPIPEDLRGQRVLDIGAWDGWFSFEMERRGAEVVAVDCVEVDRFVYLHRKLGSRVRYRIGDVLSLDPRDFGTFDIVLFLGVLYHLKHPLLALERVCRLTRRLAIVESFAIPAKDQPRPDLPYLEFYESNELRGQLDNWFGPSVDCAAALARAAGFARVNLLSEAHERACFACYRQWEGAPGSAPAPTIHAAAHHWNYGFNFQSDSDDFLSCWFSCESPPRSREEVRPEVGGFGVPAAYVRPDEGGAYLANFRLPPGLAPGWHEVTLRVGDSARSRPVRIAVGLPLDVRSLEIRGCCDAHTFGKNEVRRAGGGHLSLWIAGLPVNADRGNVRILIDRFAHAPLYVGEPDANGARQVNVQLKSWLEGGIWPCVAECGGVRSAAVPLTIR